QYFVDADDTVPQQVYFAPDEVHTAIVTCGGLCPGLDTVIKEIVCALYHMYGVTKVLGIDVSIGFSPPGPSFGKSAGGGGGWWLCIIEGRVDAWSKIPSKRNDCGVPTVLKPSQSSIRNSECPEELTPAKGRAPVHVSLVRKMEDYPIKKQRQAAFAGMGRTLGSTTSAEDTTATIPAPTFAPPTPFVGLVVEEHYLKIYSLRVWVDGGPVLVSGSISTTLSTNTWDEQFALLTLIG
ncbi:ATP-dependent 6-phosphofructokinase 6-like protein, partial [Tanacetum coccineum]